MRVVAVRYRSESASPRLALRPAGIAKLAPLQSAAMDIEHEHRYEVGTNRIGTLLWCQTDPACAELRVVSKQYKARPLTVDERIGLMAHMIEATAIGQAMIVIHGQERGLQRARQALGYSP